MELKDQVCSLELAKRLKELEVKQESLFWYRKWIPSKGSTYYPPEWTLSLYKGSFDNCELISAFTVAELGEMLPKWHDSCKRDKDDWHVRVFEKDKDNICHNSFDKTEANARAKMLINLIENKLYELK